MNIYFSGARRTGRTTRFINTLQDGDRVLTASKGEKHDLERRLRERGLNVEVIHREPNLFRYEPQQPNPNGRTLMDHGFVEECYKLALADEEKRQFHWHEEHSRKDMKRPTIERPTWEPGQWHLERHQAGKPE